MEYQEIQKVDAEEIPSVGDSHYVEVPLYEDDGHPQFDQENEPAEVMDSPEERMLAETVPITFKGVTQKHSHSVSKVAPAQKNHLPEYEAPKTDFLPEIKQFLSFFQIHCFYQNSSAIDNDSKVREHLLKIYHSLLTLNQPTDSPQLLQELFSLLQDVVSQQTSQSNILKAGLRTISKLLTYSGVINALCADQATFKASELLKALYTCKIESSEQDQHDAVILSTQKLVIQLVRQFYTKSFHLDLAVDIPAAFTYFFRVLKKTINDTTMTSLHLSEGTKRNMNKMFAFVMSRRTSADEPLKQVKTQLLLKFHRKLVKSVDKLKVNPTQAATPTNILRLQREYVTFLLKSLTECIISLSNALASEVKELLLETRFQLVEVVCKASCCSEIIVRNQAQQLFLLLLNKFLILRLPVREEIEVMFTKVILTPIEQKTPTQGTASPNQKDEELNCLILEDDEDKDGTFDKTFSLETHLSFMMETLLSLQPEFLAHFFLVYDCQPFSGNLVRRTLQLLIKHSVSLGGDSMTKCFNVLQMLFQLFENQYSFTEASAEAANRTISGIQYMLDQKSATQKLCKLANVKPKPFFKHIEDKFQLQDETGQAKVAAKCLLYSRLVEIDKIAEFVGGKDSVAKKTLEAYLDRQDYRGDAEFCLRSFMQTFRMAGIDSQVVFRILEEFGDKFYLQSGHQMFVNKQEAYDFAYLLIVLQTCQHNKAIKEKTTLERFQGQAKEMAPESFAKLPEGFVESVFNRVTKSEIKAPVTRCLIKGEFVSEFFKADITFRLQVQGSSDSELTEHEFLSTCDLDKKQLFDFDNRISGLVPSSFIGGALKYLVNILTAKFCQLSLQIGDSRFNQLKKFETTKQFIQTNAQFRNKEWVDKLLFDLERQTQNFAKSQHFEYERKLAIKGDFDYHLWSNFSSLKSAVALIPQLVSLSDSAQVAKGVFTCFQAAETRVRMKYNVGLTDAPHLSSSHFTAEGDLVEEQKEPVQVTFVGSQPSTSGIFDMVYNYFTDSSQPNTNQIKVNEQGRSELEALSRLLDGYGSFITQTPIFAKADLFETLEAFNVSEEELVSTLVTFIGENLNSEAATNCLSLLFQLMLKRPVIGVQVGTGLHSLLMATLKPENKFFTINAIVEEAKSSAVVSSLDQRILPRSDSQNSSFERLSTKSDSFIDHSYSHTEALSTKFLNQPKRSAQDQDLLRSLNRHCLLLVYLKAMRIALFATQDGGRNDVLKLVQKILKTINIEDGSKIFEEAFLCSKLAAFLSQKSSVLPVTDYPTLHKLLHILTIMMLRTNCDTINSDYVKVQLLELLKAVSKLFLQQNRKSFDLLNLCIDVMLKQNLPFKKQHYLSSAFLLSMVEAAETMLEVLAITNDESAFSFDVWFKTLRCIQVKVLLCPYLQQNIALQQKACTLIKNSILSFHFDQHSNQKTQTKKLFQEMLFHLTYERLGTLRAQMKGLKISEEPWALALTQGWDDEMEGFATLCQLCINMVTDVFINYTSSLDIASDNVSEGHKEEFDLFTVLWFSFMRLLLLYAEEATNLNQKGRKYGSAEPLLQSVHDNIQRVMEYLLSSHILLKSLPQQTEGNSLIELKRFDLYQKSKEVIGAFWVQNEER